MKMATPWKDIDDKFCVCSICLDQLKEPKLMPCLHRYCKDCLGSIIQGCNDVFRCPECREEIPVPTNGVDGFKTDFYSKSLVEFVQIHQSLKSDEIRECYGCSKHVRIAAYCFKCNDFLCKNCHNLHMTNNTLKDHQKHSLSVEDIEAKNITVEKLASMKDAPRCHNHPEQISQLFCETCDSLTVCMTCTFGEHKGHDLHDVKVLAKLKRKELAEQIKTLEKIEKINSDTDTRQAKEKLTLNATIEKEKLVSMCDEKVQKIMQEIDEIDSRREQVKQEKQNKEKQISDVLQREMENEIQEVKEKYEEILKVKKIEIGNDFQAKESFLEKKIVKLNESLALLSRDKEVLLESIEKQLQQNTKTIETISEHFDNIKRRFETLNVLASNILASENDWSAVQCIPDMCAVAANIMEDLKTEFPELTKLTDVAINYTQSLLEKSSPLRISEQAETRITIDEKYHFVDSVASSGDGNIVITGITSGCKASFIIVIDMKGKVLKEKILKVNTNTNRYGRYCHFLSHHKVATVNMPNEIGVYDVRVGSYIKKNISDVIISWPKNSYVTRVATDPVNNHILVGGYNSRDVYVFDDQLKYLHILTLPDMIKWPFHMTVSDDYLLVCDSNEPKTFMTTMEGLESKVVREFLKPNLEGNDLKPYTVCTDKNGFVYVVWKCRLTCNPGQSYLVQYNEDGSQILTTRKLDENAYAATVVETSVGEKLVVATLISRTVYVYGLVTEDV